MNTFTHYRAAQRLLTGALTILALGLTTLRPTLALPPAGGGPDPAPKPKPTYHADLHLEDAFRFSAFDTLVYIKNEGNAASTPCCLGVQAFYNGRVIWAGSYTIPALQPGQEAEIYVRPGFNIYTSGLSMYFKADFYNQVVEWNEDNNTDTFSNP